MAHGRSVPLGEPARGCVLRVRASVLRVAVNKQHDLGPLDLYSMGSVPLTHWDKTMWTLDWRRTQWSPRAAAFPSLGLTFRTCKTRTLKHWLSPQGAHHGHR